MEEQVLFHLRLPSLGEDDVDGKSLIPSSTSTTNHGRALICTSIHCSSASTVAVGFKHGLVHIYRRVLSSDDRDDDDRQHCEEARWCLTVVEPTTALNSGKSVSATASLSPDVTCLAVSPVGDMLALGTSNGYLFVMPMPAPPSAAGGNSSGRMPQTGRGGFHHKSHGGKRINCVLWDNSGDRLFSVCEGGTVVMVRNLRPRREAPAPELSGMNGVMSFLGMQQPPEAKVAANAPLGPEAFIVGKTGSPGVQLDLGRTDSSWLAVSKDKGPKSCDVLLVVTRKRAVLLYFAVGEDVSMVAPYQTSVDLNVVEHFPDESSSVDGRASSGGIPISPPSRADLGACLWGPARSLVGNEMSPRDGKAASQRRGSKGRKAFQAGALAPAAVGTALPRPVSFAYVAQPGGKLWRVTLSDGEVESTHRPLGIANFKGCTNKNVAEDEESTVRGLGRAGAMALAESGEMMELGQLWPVYVGDLESQVILCWRTRQGSDSSGEFALLDPKTHRFVASCPALPSMVNLSGSLLVPSTKPPLRQGASGSTMLQQPSAFRETIRVLHGEHALNVSQLCLTQTPYHSDRDSASVGGLLSWPMSNNAAAVRIQRAWVARKARQDERASELRHSMPNLDDHSSASMYGGEPVPSLRGVAMDDTSEGNVDNLTHSTRRKRQRSMERREAASRKAKFSIRESLDALDAADRVLQLSASSENISSGSKGYGRWYQGERPRDGDLLVDAGVPLDSGSPEVRALMRDTDALIRQTWPVLRRVRSSDQVTSPSISPRAMRMSTSVPASWATRNQGSRAAATQGAEADRPWMANFQRGASEWAVTSRGRTSSSLDAEGQHKPRSRSLGGFEADNSPTEFLAAPTTMPYPRGRASDSPSPDFQQSTDKQRRGSLSSTQDVHTNNLFGPVQNMWGSLLQRSVQAVNDALQPGGGATSDDTSSDDRDDKAFARQRSHSHYGGGGGGLYASDGSEETLEADGGMTSDTAKQSWGVSSDKSEFDSRSNSAHSMTKPSHHVELSSTPGEATQDNKKEEEKKQRENKHMLFASGMMGVKRQRLGKLRSRRETKVSASPAVVMELPSSAMDDPSPFIPPSQYEVRLNVSKGLGLSLNITGNVVRVKGFSPVQGGEIGPAQACGQIQIGDALVRVNYRQLTLLNHDAVVSVLRGVINTSADQLVLMRFEYAEDSSALPLTLPPPSSVQTQPPAIKRQSSQGTLASHMDLSSRMGMANDVMKIDGFRSESWHGSRNLGGRGQQQGGKSDATLSGDNINIARRLSHTPGETKTEGSPTLGSRADRMGLNQMSDRSDRRMRKSGAAAALSDGDAAADGDGTITGEANAFGGAGGMKGRNKRLGRLWGESDMRVGLGGGGNRHVYLGDMGLAQAQKTLGDIARDIQSLHRISHSAEEARFFHGRGKPSLTDLSATSVESRTPSPSAMLIAAPSPSSPRPSSIGNAFGGFDSPPQLPRDLYRGRRRRRPRRRRSSFRYHGLYGVTSEFRGGGVGGEAELGSTIDLPACREVVRGELLRLEKDLKGLAARLARRNRWSDVRSLVVRLVTPSTSRASPLSLPAQNFPRRRRSTDTSWKGTSGYGNTSLRVWDMPEIDAVDDDWIDFLSVGESDCPMSSTVWDWGVGVREAKREREQGTKTLRHGKEVDTEISTACDIFLEAVKTANMEDELLETLAPEVLCVDPPRPLPGAAYDLQTALESVQHFATQTLSGVVQAQAVRGTSEEFSTGASPMPMGGGQWRATEAREAAAAAGLREEWELWWPPRELTAALALVTARQMANTMRCDAEPLMQIWMRCFSPLGVQHREKVWGALAPSSQDNPQVYQGRWHRQLVCGLVTLFAQVHLCWSFLGRPSDDPAAVGLNSLKLETCWFSTCDTGGNRQRADSVRVGDSTYVDGDEEDPRVDETNRSSEGLVPPSVPTPEQWDDKKVMEFIQDYGSYLEADTLAAAVSCRAMEEPLKEVFKLAEQCGDYKARERILHQLLRGQQTSLPRSPNASPILRSPSSTPGSRTPTITSPHDPALTGFRVPVAASPSVVDAALRAQARPPGALEEEAVRKALDLPIRRGDAPNVRSMRGFPLQRDGCHRTEETDRFDGGRFGGDEPPGSAPLCLLLNNLGELFRWDTAAAADICADAFPGVRPWNVHCALHDEQEKPWSSVEPSTPLARGAKAKVNAYAKYSMGDDSAARKDVAFQAYLWAMMERHPTVCRKDWKMVQRCLQLSLRLSTRLRSLPPDHPLQAFCQVATRSVKYRRRRADSECSVVGLTEAVPFEKPSFASPSNFRESQRDENGSLRTKRHIREDLEAGGGVCENAVWRRYSEMVQNVVIAWCRDQETYHLDPVWLLTKLKDWSMTFKVCGVVARSWEEYASSGVCPSEVSDSINAVFGGLAEACFASFEGADTKTLATAIAAVWAADGAFRRASKACSIFEELGKNCHVATQYREEDAHQEGEECLPVSHDGGCSTSTNSSDSLAHSKMLDVIRRLTPRCAGLQRTDEGSESGDVKVDDVVEGVDVRVDVPMISEVSALELAEAILDGVGPETTGSVLAACPPLLDNLPPKFFRTLADRQADLLRQQALEAELSRRAAAAVWAARGYGSRAVGRGFLPAGCGRGLDHGERRSPLGPRLAWLAVEELTSFFRRNHDNLPDSAMLPLPYLSNNAGGPNGADQSASHDEEHVKNAVARAGVNLILPRSTHRGVALRPDSPCLLCGIPLKGSTRSPPAAFLNGGVDVGVIGAGDVAGRENDVASASGEELQVVVKPCGHGFHAVCMEEGLEGSTGWDASWWGVCGGGGMCWACSERT